jgi:hypothetical protein
MTLLYAVSDRLRWETHKLTKYTNLFIGSLLPGLPLHSVSEDPGLMKDGYTRFYFLYKVATFGRPRYERRYKLKGSVLCMYRILYEGFNTAHSAAVMQTLQTIVGTCS